MDRSTLLSHAVCTRSFPVKACRHSSQPFQLSCGVPQGSSCPGPIPFHPVYHPIKPSNSPLLLTITMRTTLNYSYLFPRPLFPPQSHSFSLWLTKSLNGCYPTSFVSTLPKQNSLIGLAICPNQENS